ncbi:MAG: hypothetical protein COX40_05490 [Candidatus Omnitrophica bacterium CG23_combo_of_CG06-09_8_20_14_all_40_11]|nr:MAG: hypothetical protein COX40_05490 [Candidatus Omnitrophica bacterium CG23_combo_of_CG06-09_8_20_14_all_40_11]
MKNKIKKITILLTAFLIVSILHLLYFKISEGNCGGVGWFSKYIEDKEYFLGISYGLSFAFIVFAFLKYKQNRRSALKAAAGGGLLAVVLWLSCFLFGCCGSPMLIVYLNLIGLSNLKIPKLVLLIMTIIFIGIGYIWLNRKSPEGCCNGKPCKAEKNEEI